MKRREIKINKTFVSFNFSVDYKNYEKIASFSIRVSRDEVSWYERPWGWRIKIVQQRLRGVAIK